MNLRYSIEILVLLLAFVIGVITKKRTKQIVKELDGFSLIHKKNDCPGTMVASISETESKARKKAPLMFLIGLAVLSLIMIGRGIYVQATSQEVGPAYLKLQGRVEVKGDSWNGDMQSFSFMVSGDGYPATEAVPDKDGNIFFGSYSYLKEGTHMFTIQQNRGSHEEISYDTQEILVVVEGVQKNNKIDLQITYKKGGSDINGINFINIYTKPVEETQEKQTEAPDIPETKGEGQLVVLRSEAELIVPDTLSEDEALMAAEDEQIRRCTYTITLRNEGESVLHGIYVRDYMPEYTVYACHEGEGDYGAIDGKEHVTIFLEDLEPGEVVEVQIYCWLKVCVPEGYIPESLTWYEVIGDKTVIFTNDPDDPKHVYRAEETE